MKLPSAKNNSLRLLTALLIVSGSLAFHLKPDQQNELFLGIWQYTCASRNDTALFAINTNDSMVIKNNGEFYYDIDAPNKHARGTWTLKYRKAMPTPGTQWYLVFSYLPDNKTRSFDICFASEDSLSLCEGNNRFCYKKR